MRFYVGTRVGRHAWLGTSMKPEEAAEAGAVFMVGLAVMAVLGVVALFGLGFLVMIGQLASHHRWGVLAAVLLAVVAGVSGLVIWVRHSARNATERAAQLATRRAAEQADPRMGVSPGNGERLHNIGMHGYWCCQGQES
jgi:hypothetical protein